MKTIIISMLCVGWLFAGDPACGAGIKPTSNSAQKEKHRLVGDIYKVLNQHTGSYHVILRELSSIVKTQFVNQSWGNVSRTLARQGFQVVDKWENGDVLHCNYLIVSNAYIAPSRCSLDLHLQLMSVKERDVVPESPSRVIRARACLVENVHEPLTNLVARVPFPAGSVLDKVLTMEEVRDAGRIWPLVKRICVSYDSIPNRWVKYNPSGFWVSIEFEANTLPGIKEAVIDYAVVSGLDPLQTAEGMRSDGAFVSRDTLGDVTFLGSRESGGGPYP